jgi:hypothetical protein
MRIDPEDVKYTLVNTPDGAIKSLVMQQGNCNAVATAMNVMTDMFSYYLDDIVIYNNLLEEHVCRIKIAIDTLKEHKFYLAEHELHFLPKELKLLDYVIRCDGIKLDPEKVDSIVTWKTHTNRDLLHGFLGLVGCLPDGTVRTPAKYVQHNGTREPVRLFGASTIVAGAEAEATIMHLLV